MSQLRLVRSIWSMGLVAFFLLAHIAIAEENIIILANPTQIINPDDGNFRLLFRPDLRYPDSSITIDQAILEIEVPLTEYESTFVSIRACPINIDWNVQAATWDFPWDTPGGDFETAPYAEYSLLSTGTKTFGIDITDLCMRWADGRSPYYGFMVGFAELSQQIVGIMHNGVGEYINPRIVIQYTRLPSE